MTKWEEQKDVVVIGSGLAGLSAAIEASEGGASVIVFEKMKITGGNTRISDGGVAAPNNYLQRKKGIEDSQELFYDDMIRAGLGLNHPGMVKILTKNAVDAVDWTREKLGVKYLDRLDRFGGHSVARCLTTRNHTGADFIKAQTRWLTERGVEIRKRCQLTRLFADNQGIVRGIQIRLGYKFPDEKSGIKMNIFAKRAVILATGGFGNDIPFRTIQNPALDKSIETTNHLGATAEGLIAALGINAAPVHLSWIQLGPWGCPDEKGYGQGARFASYCVYPAGILIDPATGHRIVNEWADRRRRSDAIIKIGHACVGIVDADGSQLDDKSLKHCLEQGTVQSFATLMDLAAAFAMPYDHLETTVTRYNHAVDEGGQDLFGKPLGQNARPLAKPPFYAIRLWPKIHYTPGGVGINTRAQVIDLHQRPISRLFAAGEVVGGIHGASRLGSCALTECIVFGRIAGQQAAALKPGNID
jgi:flavocytochrome c